MTDFRERYKRIGYDRGDVDINRALRSQRRDEDRREARTEKFGLMRNLASASQNDSFEDEEAEGRKEKQDSSDEPETEVPQKRLLQLEKWKEERNRKRLLEKKRAKPAFKVGVVHHRIYSPPTIKESTPLPSVKLCKSKEISQTENVPKRVTRATERRLALKAVTNQQKKENSRKKKGKKLEYDNIKSNDAPSLTFAPSDHQFKAPKGVTALPMFGRTETNFKSTNPSLEHSIIESPKFSTSDKSEIVFPPSIDNHSFILAKSSTKLTNLHSSLLHKNTFKKQDSINNPDLDSINNSSIESVVLKMSSDDLETLDDQENVHSSRSRFSDATKYFIRRRSSRVLTPTELNVSHEDVGKTDQNKKQEKDKSINNSSSRKSKRFSIVQSSIKEENMVTNQEFETSAIETSNSEDNSNSRSSARNKTARNSTRKNEKSSATVQSNQEEVVNQSLDTTEKIIPRKKKSMKDFNSQSTQNEVSKESAMEFTEARRSTRNLKSANIVEKPSNDCIPESDEVTVEQKQITPSTKKRKSRVLNKTSSHEEEAEKATDVKFSKPKTIKKKHLLDSTLSEDFKNSTRFTTEIFPILPDQSLIKFSPRRSVRAQPEVTKNPTSATATISSPDNRITYSLVKLSPLKIPVPTPTEVSKESSSLSKSMKDETHLPVRDNDIKQNFSLNVSLPKSTSPDRPLAYFSPYVVTSRGKSSSRKEVQKRRFSQPMTNPDELPTKETVMQKLNISVEEEERTAQYYKHILNQEIDRLNECCDNWDKIKESGVVPEETHYQIIAAIGHTKLLIRKKFERFRGLVLDCETGKGEMLVTCKDLQGFWDMMYREIKDCDNKFNKLESLKSNNWVDNELESKEQEEKNKKKVVKKPAVKKKPVVSSKPSSLRAHIMAARKKQQEKQEDNDVEMKEVFNTLPKEKETSKKVETPKVNRRTSTPKSANSRKVATSSGNRKSVSSSLVTIKISKKLKTPEVHSDESIVYINSNRTPAKGILKSAKDETFVGPKSANKVFFSEQPMEVQEFDCTKGITEHSDGEFDQPAEPRRLNFESDSFNGSHTESEKENENRVKVDEDELVTIPSFSSGLSHTLRPPSPILSLSPFNVVSKNSPLNVPKIKIIETSPVISMSPLNLNDKPEKNSSSKKSETNNKKPKKQITFKEDTAQFTKSSTVSARLTPKPKTRKALKSDDKDTQMEEGTQANENASNESQEPQQNKVEFYLNEQGIISQRTIETKKKTPKLKRSNSERLAGKNSFIGLVSKSSFTPQLKTKHSMDSDTDLKTPESSADTFAQRSANSSTPRVKRQNSKKLDADITPKIRNRTPTARNNSSPKGSIKKNTQLSRSKSFNVRKMVLENELSKEQTENLTPNNSRRKNSRVSSSIITN